MSSTTQKSFVRIGRETVTGSSQDSPVVVRHDSESFSSCGASLRLATAFRVGIYFCSILFGFVNLTLQAQRSLSVEQAVTEALKNNWDLRLARIDAELSTANNNWASAGAYPTLGANAALNTAQQNLRQEFVNGSEQTRTGVGQSTMSASLNLSWRIFDGMRMFATKARLEELQSIGELQFRNQISQSVYEVSLSYYNLVRLQQQLRATKELLVVLEERLKLAALRYSIGTSARSDALQAEIDVNDQRASLLIQEKNIKQAEVLLSQLMGLKQADQFVVSDSIGMATPFNTESLPSTIESQNYALLSAQRDLGVALQVRREIASQGLPSVNLGASYNFSRVRNSDVIVSVAPLLNQTNGFVLGIGVSIPIFNGLSTQTQLELQDISIRKAEVQIETLRSKVLSSYESAIADLNNAEQIYALQRSTLDLARENTEIAMERFRRQSITTVELRQIQFSVLQAYTNMLNTRFSAKAAELQLMLLSAQLQKP